MRREEGMPIVPKAKRRPVASTDQWEQLHFDWPEQHAYELIRPVVLFGLPAAERAQQTRVVFGL